MKVFVSYSRVDIDAANELLDHLRRDSTLTFFTDQQIPPGAVWRATLMKELESGDAGILLLSINFLKSNECLQEARVLCERLPPERVIPIRLKACDLEDLTWLNEKQILPTEEEPLCTEDKLNARRALPIVKRIRECLSPPPESAPLAIQTARPGREVPWPTVEKALIEGNGKVILVLGSGIHTPQFGTPAADQLRARIELLRETLGEEPEVIFYLDGILNEKLPGALHSAPSQVHPQEQWRSDLVALQAALARLGAFASRLFAHRMKEDSVAVVNVRSLKVSLRRWPAFGELQSLLLKGCQRAAALFDNPELATKSEELGLGVRGIFEQLMALTSLVANPEDRDGWFELLARLNSGAKASISSLRTQDELALHQVEWIADLLWHTLRFDAPLYPQAADLAFQISVCIDRFTPPRTESFGTITSLAIPSLLDGSDSIDEYQRLVQNIAHWLEPAAALGDDPTNRALARILCHRHRFGTSRGSDPLPTKLPLAVTTNLDDELELRLRRFRISHHVVLPVWYGRRSGSVDLPAGLQADFERDWLIRDEIWSEDQPFPRMSWRLLEHRDLTTEEFSGPLIVKLYGSPRTKIDESSVSFSRAEGGRDSRRWRFLHRLRVSDVDFLVAIRKQDWLPRGLDALLYGNPNRLIYFLGYTLSDYESRFRLFGQINHGDRKATIPTVMVSPPQDPIYRYYLERMRADAVVEEISYLCSAAMIHCDPLQKGAK